MEEKSGSESYEAVKLTVKKRNRRQKRPAGGDGTCCKLPQTSLRRKRSGPGGTTPRGRVYYLGTDARGGGEKAKKER